MEAIDNLIAALAEQKPSEPNHTATFRKVLAAATAAFQTNGRTPSVEEIAEYCNTKKAIISKIISTQEFINAMEARGFDWYAYSRNGYGKLSPEQEFCVAIITDPTNRRDLAQKLRQAGVGYQKYRNWLKQPHFKAYIDKVSEDMLKEHVGDVHTMLVSKAINGSNRDNLQAIKLYYEITGRLLQNSQNSLASNQDLTKILGMILEIITRHVTNPVTLNLISADIQAVLAGKSPHSNILALEGEVIEEEESLRQVNYRLEGVVVGEEKNNESQRQYSGSYPSHPSSSDLPKDFSSYLIESSDGQTFKDLET